MKNPFEKLMRMRGRKFENPEKDWKNENFRKTYQ
jgi:hypothetical protein